MNEEQSPFKEDWQEYLTASNKIKRLKTRLSYLYKHLEEIEAKLKKKASETGRCLRFVSGNKLIEVTETDIVIRELDEFTQP